MRGRKRGGVCVGVLPGLCQAINIAGFTYDSSHTVTRIFTIQHRPILPYQKNTLQGKSPQIDSLLCDFGEIPSTQSGDLREFRQVKWFQNLKDVHLVMTSCDSSSIWARTCLSWNIFSGESVMESSFFSPLQKKEKNFQCTFRIITWMTDRV